MSSAGETKREGFARQTRSFEPCSEFTSNRWELTFFPFFIQVMRGFGSPTAWHTNDATPPEIPVWSSGDLMKLGMPEGERQQNKGEEAQIGKQKEEKITSIRWRALTEKQLEANYRDFTTLHPLLAITILLFFLKLPHACFQVQAAECILPLKSGSTCSCEWTDRTSAFNKWICTLNRAWVYIHYRLQRRCSYTLLK